MLRSRRFWLGMIFGLSLLALFLYGTDFAELGSALGKAQYAYLPAAVAVYFVAVAFRTLRWRYLLVPLKKVPSGRLFPIVVIGYMANNLLPARLGEVVRAYIVGEKEGISKAAALATAIVERLFDGLALVILLLVLAPLVPLRGISAQWTSAGLVLALLLISGAIVVLLALLFLAALSSRAAQAMGRIGLRLVPRRFQGRVRELGILFYSGLEAMRMPGPLLAVVVLSFLVWLAEFSMYYLVALAFPLGRPFWEIAFGGTAANLAISVPSLPGGVGPFEVAFLGSLLHFGADRGLASAYIIVLHATVLLPVTVLGLAFLWRENLSLSRIARPIRDEIALHEKQK
ncbi:MAG: flippase-like domain-containing protein [Chloroflexi bacterium]|nr:flippase-like domain-containing protein [Chloroflexota bacterium]